MKSLFTRRGVFRSLVMAIAIGALGVSAGALAANKTSGVIYGEAQPGATVTATSQTGLSRTANVGNSGSFRLASLPPGTYTVKAMQNGSVVGTRTVRVSINHASHVTFAGQAQQLGTISVVGGAINPIDVTNTSTTLTLNAAQFDQLPVARNTNAITLLAPSVQPSAPLLGIETTSFGGASAAENAYYFNGLNVTDNLNLVRYAHPPFEALEEYQVLTGGMDSSFGGALGGILNVVSKSGTNTFHAGVNVYYAPPGLYSPSPDSLIRVPHTNDIQYENRNSANSHSRLRYNVYGSGPIVKDHLFFYALYQGTNNKDKLYSATQYTHRKDDSPQGLLKIDYQINDANLLEFTGYDAKYDEDEMTYTLAEQNTKYVDPSTGQPLTLSRGSKAYIGRYTVVPTDNFNISAMFGYVRFDKGEASPAAANCPIAEDLTSGAAKIIGCWTNQLYNTPQDHASRHEARIDGEWTIAGNDITFGYDKQVYYSTVHQMYSGGAAYIYRNITPNGLTQQGNFPIPEPTYVSKRVYQTGTTFKNYQHSYYLQDKLHLGNFYLRVGARSLAYENDTGAGVAFVDISDQIAPRLGLSWDVFGDSSLKVFASANQYYIPTSGDLNQRDAAPSLDSYQFYTYKSIDPKTGAPVGAKQFGGTVYVNGSDGSYPNLNGVVSHNLKPEYENEFILGAKWQLAQSQWSIGLRFIRRNLKSAIDDRCGINPTPSLVAQTGYTSTVKEYVAKKYGQDIADNLTVCAVLNPGKDLVLGTPQGKELTIPASVVDLPDPTRYYNAAEFSFDRAFDGKWFLHGTVTWSHLYGNEEGYTYSTIGQVDAGLTELFDFPAIMDGAYGNLANDRAWQIKLYGAYQFAPEWRLGFNFAYYSGRALSCLGTYNGPNPHAAVALYQNDTHYCAGQLVPEGSYGFGPRDYNVGGSIHYLPKWAPGLKLGISVINMFNFHNGTSINQYAQTANGNPNAAHGAVQYFQQPRFFRFSVEYDFL